LKESNDFLAGSFLPHHNSGAAMAAKTKVANKKAAKRKVVTGKRKAAVKRELVDTGTNKLFVRRNARGTSFKEVVDVSRSLAADRRQHSKTVAKPGQGDKGDRKKR
jgi:hypothetical protein